MTVSHEIHSDQLHQILDVVSYFPFLGEPDPCQRLLGLRQLGAEGLMYMTAAVNRAILEDEWASGTAWEMFIGSQDTDPRSGDVIDCIDYEMPRMQDRVELFEFTKSLIDQIIDIEGIANPSQTIERCALVAANAYILIHPAHNANGRTGRVAYSLLIGEHDRIEETLQGEDSISGKFGPYDQLRVLELTKELAAIDGINPANIGRVENELDSLFDRRDNRALDAALDHISPLDLRNALSNTLQQDFFAAWGLCRSFPETRVTAELIRGLTNEQALALVQQDRELKKSFVEQSLLKLVRDSLLPTVSTRTGSLGCHQARPVFS
jgi:hypothetical protein